jgi:hypothetical protein
LDWTKPVGTSLAGKNWFWVCLAIIYIVADVWLYVGGLWFTCICTYLPSDGHCYWLL